MSSLHITAQRNFNEVAVGDKVMLPTHYTSKWPVVTVERLTATLAILSNGDKARRETGDLVGEKFTRAILLTELQVTKLDSFFKVKQEYQTLAKMVRETKFSLKQLRAMKAALDALAEE